MLQIYHFARGVIDRFGVKVNLGNSN